ncbi:hypothetical protein HAX54_029566, partial [Datura stramonium]|nr:hypothetical protein [Datura stramonium]
QLPVLHGPSVGPQLKDSMIMRAVALASVVRCRPTKGPPITTDGRKFLITSALAPASRHRSIPRFISQDKRQITINQHFAS